MTAPKLFCLVFCLYLSACSGFRSSEWDLPVKLGASKSEVYAVLGRPSYRPTDHVEWFQNSGLAISYDPSGHVSEVIIHGESNSSFTTYKEFVIYGVRVTDTLSKLSAELGQPISVEDDPIDRYLASEGAKNVVKQTKVYKWRKQPYFIEADVWTADVTEAGRLFKAGTIRSLTIGRAVGGQ